MGTSRTQVKKKKQSKGNMAKKLRITEQKLREFEREGLFEYVDKSKRYIDLENFERIRMAVSLQKELGVNLEGVDVILAMREKMKVMKEQMNDFLSSVRKELKGEKLKDLSRLERRFQVGRRSGL